MLKKIAKNTWNRFPFSYAYKVKYSETTITENILYYIYQHNLSKPNVSIDIFEAKNEKANGNDLEIWYEIKKDEYLFIALQAKKVDITSKKYKSISHKVSANTQNQQFQIELLENYANLKQGIACYLLYNYSENFVRKNKKEYGCSLVCSDYIKKNYFCKINSTTWKVPSFADLHDKMNCKNVSVPFYILALKKQFIKFIKNNNLSYTLISDSLISYDQWVAMKSFKIDKAIKVNKKNNTLKNNSSEFDPKYRIVFKNE